MSENQDVDADEIAKIRSLEDFDLIMLISEIHDCGWPVARATLCFMPPGEPDDAGFKARRDEALKTGQWFDQFQKDPDDPTSPVSTVYITHQGPRGRRRPLKDYLNFSPPKRGRAK